MWASKCKEKLGQGQAFVCLFICFVGFADERNCNLFACWWRWARRKAKGDAQAKGERLKQGSQVHKEAGLSVHGWVNKDTRMDRSPTGTGKQRAAANASREVTVHTAIQRPFSQVTLFSSVKHQAGWSRASVDCGGRLGICRQRARAMLLSQERGTEWVGGTLSFQESIRAPGSQWAWISSEFNQCGYVAFPSHAQW